MERSGGMGGPGVIKVKWKPDGSNEVSLGWMDEGNFIYHCSIHDVFLLETGGQLVLGWYDRGNEMTTWSIIDFKEKI